VDHAKARSAAAPKACDASDFDQLRGQIGIDATPHLASLQAARSEALTAATRLVRQHVGPDAVRWPSDTITGPHRHWSPFAARGPPSLASRNPLITNLTRRPA
jgi:hypothetical protein